MARYLDLGFPVAAMLLERERHWLAKALATLYFPAGLAAVLVTGSRGGLLAAIVSLAGCALLLMRTHRRGVAIGIVCAPILVLVLWLLTPPETLGRLATLVSAVYGGNLNQRENIWQAGWQAFAQAPLLGTGAGSFVSATGLAPINTAHNTALGLLVETGLAGFGLALLILVSSIGAAWRAESALRSGFLTMLLVWIVASSVGSASESRTTWLMVGVIALAQRVADPAEDSSSLRSGRPERMRLPGQTQQAAGR